MTQLSEYLWVVICGGLFCFTLGFGIGANDVSNNFGTSIGSKSITLKHAIIIAAIFELIGSVGLGASVTDSVRKGVYYPETFGAMPDLILTANFCALITTTIWLLVASSKGWPVSTTHSLVGSLLGCGLAIGASAINWRFIGILISSWVIAPTCSIIVSGTYFALLRRFLLRKPDSVQKGFRWLWLLIFVTCLVFCAFLVYSNPLRISNLYCWQTSSGNRVYTTPCVVNNWSHTQPGIAFGFACAGAAALTLILSPLVYRRARKVVRRFDEGEQTRQLQDELAASGEKADSREDVGPHKSISVHSQNANVDPDAKANKAATSTAPSDATEAEPEAEPENAQPGCKGQMRKLRENMPWREDLHEQAYQKHEVSRQLANTVESFGPRTEAFFMTLQIISAAVSCLVHGSNDVSNAAAPYASIYSIYRLGEFSTKVDVHIWILFLAGAAISVGLTFLGHKVIRRVGIELLALTPSRGFCIEMGSGSVIIVASFLGNSLSTTHCTVGAMIGVALLDRRFNRETGEEIPSKMFLGLNLSTVNWHVAKRIFLAWIITLVATATVAAGLFALVVYSPTRVYTRYLPSVEWDTFCS